MDKSQTPNGVRVAPGTGYSRVEGNRRASRNGPVSELPPETPTVRFATLFHRCTRVATHTDKRVVSSGADGSLRCWEYSAAQVRHTLFIL
jgi:hypothetical protein